MCGKNFRISASAFFQVNTAAGEILYKVGINKTIFGVYFALARLPSIGRHAVKIQRFWMFVVEPAQLE